MTYAAPSCADPSDHGAKSSRAQEQLKLATVGNLAPGDLLAAIFRSGGPLGLTFLSVKASKADTAVRQRLQATKPTVCVLLASVYYCCSVQASAGADILRYCPAIHGSAGLFSTAHQLIDSALSGGNDAAMEAQLPARREARLCSHSQELRRHRTCKCSLRHVSQRHNKQSSSDPASAAFVCRA